MMASVIFDLDGTLLDTLDDLTAAVNYALGEQGYPSQSREAVRHFVGNGMEKLIGRALPSNASEMVFEKALRTFKTYYAEHQADYTHPYEGVMEMLRDLDAYGIRVAVVSNKNHQNTQALCKEYFGILNAVGGQAEIPHKPAPDGVWLAMREMGAEPERTVYVGDSEVDIETAKNAKIPCIAVLWGFRSEQDLRKAGAKHFAKTPADVTEQVLQFFGIVK